MSDYIQNATVLSSQPQVRQQIVTPSGQIIYTNSVRNLQDEFVHQHKKNGLIERLYNGLKNLTGLGVGSKKVKKVIAQAQNGEISEDQARKTIEKYRNSQTSSAQLFADGASVATAGVTFFALNKVAKYSTAGINVNKSCIDYFLNLFKKLSNEAKEPDKASVDKLINIIEKTLKTLKSDKKLLGLTIGISALVGGLTKWFIQKVNRTGSKEFKTSKKQFNNLRTSQDKRAYKKAKKANKKAKRATGFRNFTSGMINGLMMPVAFLGGIIGAPLFLLGNSLNRYFIANTNKENKDFSSYLNNFKNDSLIKTGFAATVAAFMFKKGNWTKAFNENILKATNKLADVKLSKPDFEAKSTFNEIREITLNTPEIQKIINDPNISNVEKAKQLVDTNIFAAKMKQINIDDSLGRTLKESCPPTRCSRNSDGTWNFKNIQDYLNSNLGSGYEIKKCLGVGTVAETYLVKDPSGKEVCIKVLKEGISADKIKADATVIKNSIENLPDNIANSQKKDYLKRNLEDLENGILQEIDMNKEKIAAEKIAQVTNKAKVVKPILVKNNIYVMEKAEGISLSTFIEMNQLYATKEFLEKNGKDTTAIMEIINKLKERMPDFKDIKFDKKDTEFLLNEYQKVFIEQFHKIEPNGKIIHGDIHSGNIFINPEVLKSKKGKLFTLIDTGNTIEMTADQSIRALNISKYIDNGNVDEIVEYIFEGAKHPGKSVDEAKKLIKEEIKNYFFDNKTRMNGHMNESELLTIAENIMQKHGVVPGSTQLNLNKTRTSALGSLEQIKGAIAKIEATKLGEAIENDNFVGAGIEGGKLAAKNLVKNKYYESLISAQEKENLKHLSPTQVKTIKNNPTALNTSSEEYITYKLKQNIIPEEFYNVE